MRAWKAAAKLADGWGWKFMVMSCSLSKEDRIPAMCVHPYRHRLQMVRVTAPPHTTAMIKDPVWRDRPNKQFIDDPMNHAVTAADRNPSVPVAAVRALRSEERRVGTGGGRTVR